MKNHNIQLEGGDGIEIDRDVQNLNHICCDCGLKHKIKVEWLENSVILKFKRDSGYQFNLGDDGGLKA